MKRGLFFVVAAVIGILFGLTATSTARQFQVMLDFFANPNHVPIYVAKEKGFFADNNVDVKILVPANPSDPLKLAASRTVELALSPQINFLIARSEELPLISVGALIDSALGGLLTLEASGVTKLDDLRAKRIGYSLAPLEPILWNTMLASVGVENGEYTLINVGFNTVSSLLSGKVAAIGAFRNFEVLQVEQRGEKARFFPQEDYGVPDTYEIILIVNTTLIDERPEEVNGFVRGLAKGIAYTKNHPQEALQIFFDKHPDINNELHRLAFEATLPLFADNASHNSHQTWIDLQEYLVNNGLMTDLLTPEQLFTTEFLPSD